MRDTAYRFVVMCTAGRASARSERRERPRRAPAQSMLMNTGSIIRYESWEPTRRESLPQLASRLRVDVAENLAAAFDLDLAVADRPRDPAGRLDQEPVADDQITFEAAAYLGLVDRCRALEQAALCNLDSAAVGQLGVLAAGENPSLRPQSNATTSRSWWVWASRRR